MHAPYAAQLLRSLANGLDPHTGQALAPSSPLHHADVVRALFAGAEALIQSAGPDAPPAKPPKPKPARAGQAWDDPEDQRLTAAFESGTAVAELARQHRRSKGSIRARLVRLGLVDERRQAA